MENNQLPPSPKKLSYKIVGVSVLVIAVVVIIYIIPKYWDVAGGGATIETAPDSIKVSEPIADSNNTEKFFDEVVERKDQVITDDSSSQSAEAEWKIYRNAEYNFEFSYPQNWVIKDFITNPNQSNASYDIGINYTTSEQNALRGITYCEAYSSQVPRCEVYNGFIIDWEYSSAMINDAVGGTLGIALKNSNIESKENFRLILSSFKFTK